jgi:hypothetical protein
VAASRQISNLVAQQAQESRLEPARPNPVARPGKPFAGYTAPPTTSPYMNLYRRGAGDSDNYTTLVRPLVEQQHENRVFGGEIRGLQSATRLQTSALYKLGKQPQTQAGTTAPEYFMNYRDYYPGFNR